MVNNFQHLVITREALANRRRTNRPPPATNREDLRGHGQKLNDYFQHASAIARTQITTTGGSYVLKLRYDGALTFNHLIVHGVEFVSQEDNQLCVVFADEAGLS